MVDGRGEKERGVMACPTKRKGFEKSFFYKKGIRGLKFEERKSREKK